MESRDTVGTGVLEAGRGEPCCVIEWESVARETRAIVPVSGGSGAVLEEEATFRAPPRWKGGPEHSIDESAAEAVRIPGPPGGGGLALARFRAYRIEILSPGPLGGTALVSGRGWVGIAPFQVPFSAPLASKNVR